MRPSSGPAWNRSSRVTPALRSPHVRTGVVDQLDATRIVVRATEELDAGKPGVDIYRLMKFQRSNQSTCINQRPLVKVGDLVHKGDILADGPSDRPRRPGAWPQRARRVHALEWLQLRRFDPALRKHRQGGCVHLDPYRGVRGHGSRYEARARGNHARHPERLGRSAEETWTRRVSSISAPRCRQAISCAARSPRRAKAR